MSMLESALAKLSSAEKYVRDEGWDDIGDLDLTPADGLRLIAASVRTYPEDRSYQSTSARILQHLGGMPHPVFVPALVGIYDRLVDKKDARETVLSYLMHMATDASFAAVTHLLSLPASATVSLHVPLMVPLRDTPPAGVRLLPGLLASVPNLDERSEIHLLALDYIKKGLLHVEEFPEYCHYCLARLQSVLQRFRPGTGSSAPEIRSKDDAVCVTEFGPLLELVRYVREPSVDHLLRAVLETENVFSAWPGDRDRFKLFAAVSLLARGQSVGPSTLAALASTPTLRWRLWSQLEDVGRLEEFPRGCSSQDDLAEAEMVGWLEHPAEMAMPPEDIERLTRYVILTDDEERQLFYLFRFRHSQFPDEHPGDWFVGVAGPYPFAGPPRIGGRRTFSKFGRYEAKELMDHVKEYLPEGAELVELF
jgi:hypothetical protein